MIKTTDTQRYLVGYMLDVMRYWLEEDKQYDLLNGFEQNTENYSCAALICLKRFIEDNKLDLLRELLMETDTQKNLASKYNTTIGVIQGLKRVSFKKSLRVLYNHIIKAYELFYADYTCHRHHIYLLAQELGINLKYITLENEISRLKGIYKCVNNIPLNEINTEDIQDIKRLLNLNMVFFLKSSEDDENVHRCALKTIGDLIYAVKNNALYIHNSRRGSEKYKSIESLVRRIEELK